MNLPQIIASPTMAWLPPFILAMIILLGIGFGFLNGWKSALYFCSVQMLTLLFGILSYDNLWNDILIPLLQKKVSSLGIKISLTDLFDLGKQPVMLIYLSLLLIIIWILSLIPYFIFRKKLFKKTIKSNKEKKLSNLKSRIGGATIGVISAMPYAAFFSTTATIIAPDSKSVQGMNTFTSVMSLGQANNVSYFYDDAIALLKIIPTPQSKEKLDEIIKAFEELGETPGQPNAKPTADPVALIKKNKDAIKAIIKHPKMIKSIFEQINKSTPAGNKKLDLKKEIKKLNTPKAKDKALDTLKKAGVSISRNQLEGLINQFK